MLRALQVSKSVSNLLFYVTFSANFFLYCLSGDRFRKTLNEVVRWGSCCCRRAGNGGRPSPFGRTSARRVKTRAAPSENGQQRCGGVTSQTSNLTSWSSFNSAAAATAVDILPSVVAESPPQSVDLPASPQQRQQQETAEEIEVVDIADRRRSYDDEHRVANEACADAEEDAGAEIRRPKNSRSSPVPVDDSGDTGAGEES